MSAGSILREDDVLGVIEEQFDAPLSTD